MKRIAIGLIAALSLSGAALAQSLPTVSGTVEKVDKAQGGDQADGDTLHKKLLFGSRWRGDWVRHLTTTMPFMPDS